MLALITAPDLVAAVEAAIQREPRLGELLAVRPAAPAQPPQQSSPGTGMASPGLFVSAEGLAVPVDWAETLPPVVLARPLPFTAENLLTLVFLQLGNWEKAYEYSAANPGLSDDVDLLNRLQGGAPVTAPAAPVNDVGSFDHYRRWHNRAVALHYGHLTRPAEAEELQASYRQAIAAAPSAEWHAFSTKHYATFLLDTGLLDKANHFLQKAFFQPASLSEAAHHELQSVETGVLLQQLTVPYDAARLAELKDKLWQTLAYYERHKRPLNAALVLLDAAQVANFADSFAEALGYLNRAVALLGPEDVPELLANAQYRKGVLLFTWAQHGNPQFYRAAMDAYQQALKVFTRNNAYPVFAEIQHHLGVIYSEIPDEVKKKSIWAAVSVSSFNQALEYFTRDTYPYEYATVCNHYANALTKYPLTIQTDKFAKALGYYREALAVRTAQDYPYERALTQLNFLEAAWQVNLEHDPDPEALLAEMRTHAHEAAQLAADPALAQVAQQHLARLETVAL